MSLVGRANVSWKEEVLVTSRYVKPRHRLKKMKAHEQLCRLEQHVSIARLVRRAGADARPRSSTFAGARARSPESANRCGAHNRKRQRSAPSRDPAPASASNGGVAGGVDFVQYVQYSPSPPPPPPQFAGSPRFRSRAGGGRGPGSGFGMESSGKDTSSEDTGSVHSLSTLFSMSSLASVPENHFMAKPLAGRGAPGSFIPFRTSSDKAAAGNRLSRAPKKSKSAARDEEQLVTLSPGSYTFPFRFRLPVHLPCSLRQSSRSERDATAGAGAEDDVDPELDWECDEREKDDDVDDEAAAADDEEDDDGEGPLWSASAEYAVRVALEGYPDACAHVAHRSFTVIRHLDLKDEPSSLAVHCCANLHRQLYVLY